jgi:hypothetical protein
MEQVIQIISHFFGFCPDHHSHLNMLAFMGEIFNQNICWCYLKMKYNSIKEVVKNNKVLN